MNSLLQATSSVDGTPNSDFSEGMTKISGAETSLIMLSGGIDSTTLLYLAQHLGNMPRGVEFIYEGKPSIESALVDTLSRNRKVALSRIKYPTITTSDGMDSHFRESNSFYYSIASAFAYSQKIQYILAGQVLDDWQGSGTEEASPEFYKRMNALLRVEYGRDAPEILAPLITLTKKQVVTLAQILNVPIGETRSCTSDTLLPCGVCEQCKNRNDALNS